MGGADRQSLKTLAADVLRLSRLLTREREHLPAAYLADDGLRNAYRSYFLPPNARKVSLLLSELASEQGILPDKETLRILDLGTGPGTAIRGVLEFFRSRQPEQGPLLELTALDPVAGNLKCAGDLFSAVRDASGVRATLKTIRSDIGQAAGLGHGLFDLIILANVLNELFARDEDRIGRRADLVGGTLDRLLRRDGSCIIVEPALRETSRDLLGVRDVLMERGFTIHAPCIFQGTCPALANPKDWCHEDIPWDPPQLIRDLDRLTGLRKDSLKFSFLILRKDGRSGAGRYGANAFRVVSEPLVSKGKREYYLCGADGRRIAARLDKDRADGNRSFELLQRGDVAVFGALLTEEKRNRIVKDTKVTVLRTMPR